MNIGSEIVGRLSASVFLVGDGNPTVVVAAVTGKKVRVLGYSLTGNNGGTVIDFTDGAGTNIGRVPGGSVAICPINAAGWFETAASQSLRLTIASTVVCVGHIAYQLVDA